MLRRQMLLGATALAGFTSVSAYQNITDDRVADLVVKTTTLVTALADALLPLVADLVGMLPATAAAIKAYIDKAKKIVPSLAAATTMVVAKPLVERIVDYIVPVLDIASALVLPASAARVVADAKLLLPVIIAVVGLYTPAKPAATAETDASYERLKAAARRH